MLESSRTQLHDSKNGLFHITRQGHRKILMYFSGRRGVGSSIMKLICLTPPSKKKKLETEIHIDIYIANVTRHHFQQWMVETILVHPQMNRQTKCGLHVQWNTARRNGKAIQTCYTRRLLRTLWLSKISSQKMTNVGFHLDGVPQRSSSQRQKMEWWLSVEENVGSKVQWVQLSIWKTQRVRRWM